MTLIINHVIMSFSYNSGNYEWREKFACWGSMTWFFHHICCQPYAS